MKPKARVKEINCNQLILKPIDIEKLVGMDHEVRGIWEFVSGLDLSEYYNEIESREGGKGRTGSNPHFLISLWVYSYAKEISSAREIERLIEYHPASFDPVLNWPIEQEKQNTLRMP